MSNEKLLCKNLSLSIWFEPAPEWDLIKIRLVDKLAMKKVEQKVEITVEPAKKSAYHIQEAITIAMRRLVDEAVKQGLISVTLGPLPTSAPGTRPGGINISLSMPPDG